MSVLRGVRGEVILPIFMKVFSHVTRLSSEMDGGHRGVLFCLPMDPHHGGEVNSSEIQHKSPKTLEKILPKSRIQTNCACASISFI